MNTRFLPFALAAALCLSAGPLRAAEDKHDHKKHEHKEGEKKEGEKKEETKEEKVEAKDVPAKVMAGFKRDFASAKNPEIKKETYKDGTVHYEFEFKDADGKEHEAEYNTDGEKLDAH